MKGLRALMPRVFRLASRNFCRCRFKRARSGPYWMRSSSLRSLIYRFLVLPEVYVVRVMIGIKTPDCVFRGTWGVK